MGYGMSITAQQFSLSLDFPANLSTCFSAADFTEGDESSIGVFEPNSSLDNVEIFNLLMVPGIADFSILSAALAFAERKRAFLIVDPRRKPRPSAARTPRRSRSSIGWKDSTVRTGRLCRRARTAQFISPI
jgi:hypothetical protein